MLTRCCCNWNGNRLIFHHDEAPISYSPYTDGITDYLLFNNLFNCVLVNREWHELINSILWKDVITFRSIPKSRLYWFCHDYTLTTLCQQTLEKYAHHIRAITCQGARSLRVLRTMKCKDVTEINYVVRPENDTKNAGLDDLIDWIRIISPQLRAISIEEITLTNYSLSGQLDDLLDLLDDFPHITSIYMGIDYIHNLLRRDWVHVWSRLLKRVSCNIHSLRICPDLTRSRRAPGASTRDSNHAQDQELQAPQRADAIRGTLGKCTPVSIMAFAQHLSTREERKN